MKFKRKTFFSKFYFSNLVICWCKKVLKLHPRLKKDIYFKSSEWLSPLKFIHKQILYKKKDSLGHWKNRWIQTPQWILMDPLAYNRLELDCIRKIINFWYTFGWKWRVFVTIWNCRTHVRMMSMTSSVERTDLDFKISVALSYRILGIYGWQTTLKVYEIMQRMVDAGLDKGFAFDSCWN